MNLEESSLTYMADAEFSFEIYARIAAWIAMKHRFYDLVLQVLSFEGLAANHFFLSTHTIGFSFATFLQKKRHHFSFT